MFSRGTACALAVACAALLAPASASALTITAATAEVAEGDDGTTAVSFTVGCEALDVGPVTATPGPGNPPAAEAGADFEESAVSGDAPPLIKPCAGLPFTQTINVNVIGDTRDEPHENLRLDVSVPSGGSASAQARILDDDVPTAAIAPVTLVLEGDSATKNVDVEVTLDQAAVEPATIRYSTQDDTARSGADYTGTSSGVLTIPAGSRSGVITIPIVGDTAVEQVEAFFVNLTSGTNVTLDPAKNRAAVGIFDNDVPPPPVFSLGPDVRVIEGNRGTVNALFGVRLSHPVTERTQVRWHTTKWTATPTDFEPASGTLVFQPGQTRKTISVNVKGDRRREKDEAFGVFLENPVGGTLGRKGALGVIVDDDKPGPKMRIGKPKLVGERLVAKLRCPASADTRCAGRLTARARGSKMGSKKFRIRAGRAKKVRIPLRRRALADLRERAVSGRLVAVARDGSSERRRSSRRFRLARAAD